MAERESAEDAKRRLFELNAFDCSRRASAGPDGVAFPIPADSVDAVAADAFLSGAGSVVDVELSARRPRAPIDAVLERLRAAGWTRADLAAVPTQWHLVGDIALVRFAEPLVDEQDFAEALAQAIGARSVLEVSGIEGELREPRTRVVWGDADTRTVHRERGVEFVLDPARVMFSAGNVSERGRLLAHVDASETVVDLFAGVGYFTLPLAVHAGCRVHACELNPISAGFLREGAAANGVTDLVSVHEGDARDVAPSGVADRVLMGYVHGTLDLVPTALRCLGPTGGLLHVHETATVEEGPEGLARRVEAAVDAAGGHARTVRAGKVKNFAPGIIHAVVDVEVSP